MTLHRTVRSPVFLASLALLLVNDLYFKAQFGNWFTGKLSDFAGLVAFALFWSALFPRRSKLVHFAIGVGFVFWKLPLADPMLTLWNSLTPLDFARATDLTDLMALAMLPLSYYHFRQFDLRSDRVAISGLAALLKTTAVCAVSLFAFAATSYDTSVRYSDDGLDTDKYFFGAPRDQVVDAAVSLFGVLDGRLDEHYLVRYESDVCSRLARASFAFNTSTEPERAELQLLVVDPGYCSNMADECARVEDENKSWSSGILAGGRSMPSKYCLRLEFQELVIRPLQAYLASQPASDAPD